MSSFYTKHLHIVISLLTILALVAIIFQSKDTNPLPNFFYFPSSSLIWPTSRDSVVIDHGITSTTFDSLAHSLAVIHNSSSLSKSVSRRNRSQSISLLFSMSFF